MNIITICQRKGGVGKSTSCLNLACVFGEMGLKVLLIDLDDQQNTTKSISAVSETDYTIEDLLLQDDISLDKVTVKTSWNNVSILPASGNLSGVVKNLDGELGGHLILKEKLTGNNFDVVLIDTSPSLNILVVNALCASSFMFIPLTSKYFSLQGLKKTIESFKKICSRLNPALKLLGIAFVNHDKRSSLANEVVEEVYAKYPDETFKNIVGINIKIEEAQVKKESIVSYCPDDKGALQYRLLGKEMLSKMGV